MDDTKALQVLEEIRDLINDRIGTSLAPPQADPPAEGGGDMPPPDDAQSPAAEDDLSDDEAAALSDLYAAEGITEGGEAPAPEPEDDKKRKVM